MRSDCNLHQQVVSHAEEGVRIVNYCGVRVSCVQHTGGGMEFLCLAVAWPDVFFSSEDLNWTGTPAGDSAIISRAGAPVPALRRPLASQPDQSTARVGIVVWTRAVLSGLTIFQCWSLDVITLKSATYMDLEVVGQYVKLVCL